MRKIIYSVAILVLVFGVVSGCGCGDNKNKPQTKKIEKKQESGLGSWEPIPKETNNGNMPTF